jgi:hypothetical protein
MIAWGDGKTPNSSVTMHMVGVGLRRRAVPPRGNQEVGKVHTVCSGPATGRRKMIFPTVGRARQAHPTRTRHTGHHPALTLLLSHM